MVAYIKYSTKIDYNKKTLLVYLTIELLIKKTLTQPSNGRRRRAWRRRPWPSLVFPTWLRWGFGASSTIVHGRDINVESCSRQRQHVVDHGYDDDLVDL